jgi:hypothetical protein
MLTMGAVYGTSLLVDKTFFAGFDISSASGGLIAAKLGVHTVLILAYLAASWFIIRRPSRA